MRDPLARVRRAIAPTGADVFGRSIALNLFGRVAGVGVGFVSAVILARLLGPADRGLLAEMVSASTVVLAVTAIGQPLAVTYYASRKETNHRAILGNTCLHALVLAAVLIPLSVLLYRQIANAVGAGHGGKTWILAAVLVPITFLDWTISNQLLGMLRFGFYNALKLLAGASYALAIIVLVGFLGWGVAGGIVATAVGSAVTVAGSLRPILGSARPTVERSLLKAMMQYGSKVQVGVIFTMVNYRLDVVIMQFFRPLAQVGYYVVAQTIAELSITLATAFQSSLLPFTSHYEGDARQREVTIASLRHHGILSGIAALANTVVGSLIIYLAYGSQFRPAIVPMLILLPGVWFLGTGFIVQSNLGGRGLPGLSSKIAGVAAATTVVLDFGLIPPLGVVGGALASVTAYTVYGVLSLVALSRASAIPIKELVVPTREDFALYSRALRTGLSKIQSLRRPRDGRPARKPYDAPLLSASLPASARARFMSTRRLTPNRFLDRPARPTWPSRSPRGVRAPPGSGSLVARHPNLAFGGAAGLGLLCLLPGLTQPTLALMAAAALVAGAIAWRSVAIPLALGGIPPLIDAVVGSSPLPKGGFTFVFSVWIAAGVGFGILRGTYSRGVRAALCIPMLASMFLLGLMLLRLGPSAAESYGSTKVQLYVADVLIFFVGAIFVGSRRRDVRLFFNVQLGVFAAGSLLFLYNLVAGHAQAVVGGRYALSALEYPIELGRDSSVGILIAIYIMLSARARATRLRAALVVPPLAIAMVSAGSRGPVLAFVIGLLALLALSATSPQGRRRLGVVAALFLFAALIVPLVVPGSVLGRALSAVLGGASGLSSNGRSSLWALSLTTFNHHPLFGLGTGGFAALGTGLQYPHNILLEVATELGVFGAAALLAVLGGMWASLVRLWRRTTGSDQLMSSLLIALFVTALINACVSGAIQDNRDVWVWGGIAIGMNAARPHRRSERAP
jgi:O-antigen/teichoic acid export membrane protein